MSKRPFSIVCLSSQPWSVDLPTNRQQIMLRAARRGHRVLFVETGSFLGIHLWHLVRGPRRASLARRLLAAEPVAEGVEVCKALNLLPWGHKHRLANAVNCAVTRLSLKARVWHRSRPIVLWIYDPTAAECSCGEAFSVYDCVDDYVEQAGGSPRRRALTAGADERAATRSRLVFATTTPLYERLVRLNSRTHHVPNVADHDHFLPASERSFAASDVQPLARPVLGFAGNLVSSKVDFALLEELARARPDWTVLLIGPTSDGAVSALSRLERLENVHSIGPRRYGDLPRYVAAFDVGLIPYVSNAYTRSCFPLKLYEYLSAGKPVVATGLPELAGMEPDVVLAEGLDGVVAAVSRALELADADDRARRIAVAAKNTWETRTTRLLELVAGELEPSS